MSAEPATNTPVPRVAIAGASGFVGTTLRHEHADTFAWVALTRSQVFSARGDEGATTWRQCDLFSLPQVEEALQGVDYAVYLVHSMLPSSRLVQGSFRDLDLLLADNFVRAAEAAGVRRIVYLGGLMPHDKSADELSAHLASRAEVEQVLQSRGVPVVILRAGLIMGPGGSSTRMLLNLVRRLPVMVLPRWTRSQTQSIDVLDAVRAIALSLRELQPGVYDLAGHTPMTYREMILETAKALGRRPRTIPFPANFFFLSRRWVQWFSGVPGALVVPLLESLQYSLQARPNVLLEQLQDRLIPFRESIARATDEKGRPRPNPRRDAVRKNRRALREARRVRSVQRMPLPPGWDALQVARTYGQWLTRASGRLLHVEHDTEGVIKFWVRFPRLLLLELQPTPHTRTASRRRAYYIAGGCLALQVDPPGRFEFRVFPEIDCVVAAIHGFAPRLPWWLYAWTQAKVHLLVMRWFRRHLEAEAQEAADDPPHPPASAP